MANGSPPTRRCDSPADVAQTRRKQKLKANKKNQESECETLIAGEHQLIIENKRRCCTSVSGSKLTINQFKGLALHLLFAMLFKN